MLGPDWRLGFLFVLPIVVLVLALVAYPFCYAIYLSMTRKFVGMPPVFVGFENYVRLAQRRLLPAGGVELVHLHVRLRRLQARCSAWRWRSCSPRTSASATSSPGILLVPWVAPTVVSALNFLWIYDGSLGVLNYLLVKVFRILPQGVGWLSEPGTAMAVGHLREHLARVSVLRHLVPGRA